MFNPEELSDNKLNQYVKNTGLEGLKYTNNQLKNTITPYLTQGGKREPVKKSSTKKVRKHQGIIQTGGNKGKLKKGYKYSGKTLKNGQKEIIKVK